MPASVIDVPTGQGSNLSQLHFPFPVCIPLQTKDNNLSLADLSSTTLFVLGMRYNSNIRRNIIINCKLYLLNIFVYLFVLFLFVEQLHFMFYM